MKKTVLKKVTIYFRDSIDYNTDEEFEQKNDYLESAIQLDIDSMQQGDTDYDFNESQCLALEAASEFVYELDWAINKIRKKEYSLWSDVTDEEELGFAYAQSLELPTWAYTYFDFEKFSWDIKVEHSGIMTTFGWFTFR